MEPSVEEDDEPIYSLATECEALFEKGACLDSLAETGAVLLWEEHKERFTTWAAYLGVFAKRNLCLDRRLEHHPTLQDLVLRLLDILQRNLTRVINGRNDIPQQRALAPGEDETSVRPRDAPLIDSLKAIESALDRLNRLGVAIRESSVSSRTTRAKRLAGTPDYASFKDLAHLAVRALYPSTSVLLQEQLSASMADRYADIVSRRTHQGMLGKTRAKPQPPLPTIPGEGLTGKPDDFPDSSVYQAQARMDKSALSLTPRSVLASERPSSTNTRLVELRMGASRRSGSGRSRASSVQINQVTYPRPLNARAGENYLTCEWCFESRPKRFFEGPDWRRHVDRDLKPYVCIAEGCTDPLPSFTNFRDWHGHMLAKHGLNWHREVHLPLFWTCPFCPGVSAAFDDPDETTTHIRDFHKLALGDAEVRTIAGQSRIQMRRKHGECPICCLNICTESPEESADKRKQRQESAHPSYQHTMTGSDSAQTAQGTQAIGVNIESGVAEHNTLERKTRIPVEAVARHIASHLQALTFLTTRIMSIHNHGGTDNISQGSSADTSIQPSCNSRRSVDEDSRQSEGCDDNEEVSDLESPLDVDETGPSITWDHISLSKDLPTEEEDYILKYLQQKQEVLGFRDIPSPSSLPIYPTPEPETLIKSPLIGPKFRQHVSFDTTSHDINRVSGITLSARHDNFRAQRHSKTILVGISEDKNSEAALEWLLTDMVDDHDTVVCVRVLGKYVKPYQDFKERAYLLLRGIIEKNRLDKVLCVILEYQFGQLFPTFYTMVSVHQPSVIVTGTKGRLKRDISNRIDSVPEYCVAKLSIPVVVVRPQDVRLKKRDKRAGDPNWRTYKQMLSNTNGVHESDVIDDEMLLSSATQLSPVDEAREIAKAVFLPDEFDATTDAFDGETSPRQGDILVARGLGGIPEYAHSTAPIIKATSTGDNSDVDASDDGGDDNDREAEEANTTFASVLKQVKKEKLHEMEVGEAAALKKGKSEDLLDM